MLIFFRPDNAPDSLEFCVYDTKQERTFYTADDMIIVNSADIADKLDDFVGISKRAKSTLIIHDLVQNEQSQTLIDAFKEI